MTTPMMTADEFLGLAECSGLLPPDALAPYRNAAPGAEALARLMARDRVLTVFQARHLLRGRHKGFFLSDKYKVLEHLGEGGMGRVLLCEHLVLHKLVAVKLLTAAGGPGSAERFLREARACAALDHPNIVRVFDLERAGQVPFLVMEYVDGTNLHQLVAAGGPLDPGRAADYGRQAADGLEHARVAGLVHRDVKPGNILVDRAGLVKLLDLGLARFFDPAKNREITQKFDESSVLGTADFIAPEQAVNSSQVDIRADIYSLGCTLYYALAGKYPFEGGAVAQKLVWHQLRDPEPLDAVRPGLPPGLSDVVAVMMRKKPEERFQTPAEVAAALAPFAAPAAPPASEMPRQRPSSYRIGLCEPPSSRLFAVVEPRRGGSQADLSLEPPTAAIGEPPTPSLGGGTTFAAPVTIDAPPRRRATPLVAGAAGVLVAAALGAAFLTLGGRGAPATSGVAAAPPPAPAPAPPPVASTGGVLAGAGSTFVAPLMEHWAGLYEASRGVQVRYAGGGSGRGVEGVTRGFLLFGCTDAPRTDAQLAEARKEGRGEVLHVPLALGAVVPVYNLPGLPKPVRFTGPVLADIFLGKITRWNDDALAVSNPGVALPDLPIHVVHRSDKSGTTFIWTDYLSKASAEWAARVGAGTEVKWPAGDEGKGNDGVATAVSRRTGAVGYVELGFALANSQPYGHVKNRAGAFVAPTLDAVTAAAAAALPTVPDDLRYTLTDAPGEGAYPVCGTVWAVLFAEQKPADGRALAEFLWWATHEGQSEAKKLRYAPIPAELLRRVEGKIRAVRGAGV